MTSYKNYKIVDYDHNYTLDGKWYLRQLGEPLKIWQSTEETRYIDMFDVERTTPPGTWWQTTKITDPETIQLLDEGKLYSYSLTTANRTFADRFLQLTNQGGVSAKSVPSYNEEVQKLLIEYGMLADKHRTLIKDIKDPVGFTVSLTNLPCVGGAIFAKKCLEASQQSKKHDIRGDDKMTENIDKPKGNMSIDDFKSLFSFFSSIKADTKEEEKEEQQPKQDEPNPEYVTQDQLNKALEDNNEKIITEISKLIDEKIDEKEPEKEEDEKKEEKPPEQKEGQSKQEETSNKNQKEEEEGKMSNKHKPGSKQIDDPDNQEQMSYKKGSTEYEILKKLGRDAIGNTKIKL